MDRLEDFRELEQLLLRHRRQHHPRLGVAVVCALLSCSIAATLLIFVWSGIGTPRGQVGREDKLQSGRSQAANPSNPPPVKSETSPPFVPPSLAPASSVSLVDAARMVDKVENRSKAPRQSAPDAMPTLAVDERIGAKANTTTPLHLSVNTDGVLPEDSSIAIVGLPPGIVLSAGHRQSAGNWQLVPDDLGDLKLSTGSPEIGSSELIFRLVAPDGRVVNEKRAKLVVSGDAPVAGAREGRVENATPQEIQTLLMHGRDLQRVGYLAGARLFFQRAADAGSPEGARALGDTYDPTVLRKLGVRGLTPDPELAQHWYARAHALEAKTMEAQKTHGE